MAYIEKQWREITSTNPVSDKDFPQGLKNFKMSVGQGYGFIPAQSYFKVDLKIVKYGADKVEEKPDGTDLLTFSDSVCGNLFNNIYFNMGGQTVSSITTGLAQCDILKNRLTKSKAWNETVGVSQGFVPTHQVRNDLLNLVVADSSDPAYNTQRRYEQSFIWQPCLGIFDVADPLGSGEYEIILNPSQDYQTAGLSLPNVSDGTGVLTSPSPIVIGQADGQYGLVVTGLRFYACMVRTNLASSGPDELLLTEMSVHSKPITKGQVDNIDMEVSVPSSTMALTLFLQDQQAGKIPHVPPSKFHLAGNNEDALSLDDYQIEYAGMIKPTVRYKSEYDVNKNKLQQRYINSALESGQYFNPSGFESYLEYTERGPFLHETFIKSADNLATRVHVSASYKINPTGAEAANVRDSRLFVIAHHTRTVKIVRQNGLILNVLTQNS